MVNAALAPACIESSLGTSNPDGWDITNLGSLADLYQPETISAAKFTSYGYPVFGANGYVGFFDKYNHENWQITVTCRGSTCGTVNRTVEKCWITGNSMVVNCDNNKNINKEFLYHLLKNQNLSGCITGTGQPQIVKAPLANFTVSVPLSLIEQKAIAEALTDADNIITSLGMIITKKRSIKQAATQDLLSGQRRLAGFDSEWDSKTFSEVFDFYPTATNSRADLDDSSDTYYIHYGDIHTRFHSHLDFKRSHPSRIARAKCPNAAYVRNGDWIMADASEDYDGVCKSIEVLGLSEADRVVSGLHTFLLREKSPTFVPGFKGHLGNLKSLRDQYMRVMTGMKVFGVSKAALRDLVLPVPSPKEQEAIVTILSEMAADIAALEEKLSKARLVKQGMMQQLLTGKVRLV